MIRALRTINQPLQPIDQPLQPIDYSRRNPVHPHAQSDSTSRRPNWDGSTRMRRAVELNLSETKQGCMDTRIERTFRGISERLAVRYLTNLGGSRVDDDTVDGEDWSATVSSETVGIGPSLTLTEVTVVFEGDERTLEPLVEDFAQKAMRAGG